MCSENDELPSHILNILNDSSFNNNYWNIEDVLESSWLHKPMQKWSPSEVLEFIKNETICHVSLERFTCISGYIFRGLSKDYCQKLSCSMEVGEIIFEAKEKYIRNSCFDDHDHLSVLQNSNDECTPTHFCADRDHPVVQSTNNEYTHFCDNVTNIPKRTRKIGRPKSACINRRKCHEKKSEKLWQFLLHLLNDDKTCPEIIKWENFKEGTFKFVKNDRVARLWGNRKQNKNMTYEKFTRAMRYYYKSQVLLPVPGKRLVYKFGPHAKR